MRETKNPANAGLLLKSFGWGLVTTFPPFFMIFTFIPIFIPLVAIMWIASIFSGLRPTRPNVKPILARFNAASFPIPSVAPVMMHTLPWWDNLLFLFDLDIQFIQLFFAD